MHDGAAGTGADGAAAAEFALAAMEILEPFAERYGLFLAERTCWHLLFANGQRILDVACDPWTCWTLGARVGLRESADTAAPRALGVQEVLQAVYGLRENTWRTLAADPAELREVLRTLAVLLDRYCAELLLDDEAFDRAERLVRRTTVQRGAFLREFEEH
ncbi:hypothetical protein [Frankia sp. R82]|uniref:hypothetical protein n=1 Tax=Frankia sp. R82 TaxID=2950553 RepID=UPI002044A625|nr:hypothetical protein [Frankia sp. R82]MCM3886919.1 hypothetical protein [Frankia sp. R82]